ncbi:MAG TPA: IS110 family transposase [Verrucomicrobiae bacterium]|nr:IS110 family transposase [Verrucomicrobiae bacterium]
MAPLFKGNPPKQKSSHPKSLQVLHLHAAGIDLGAREIYVAVPPDSCADNVRSFPTFTEDLHALRDWLQQCGVTTVAMESTGVYWIPLFQILEAAGIEVCLVNARHCKNLPGRKTDVQDCQWLQYLHSVGLLRGSFRPADQVCAVRTLLRHREALVRGAARCVSHLHKALTQMNVQLHHVISDLTGVTGQAILNAILAGERDPQKLAALKDHRIKASRDVIAKSLRGDWRGEHLFTLKQTHALWQQHQTLIAECDAQIEAMLQAFDSKVDGKAAPVPRDRTSHRKQTATRVGTREACYRVLGVDLTAVPGFQTPTALVLLCELGPEFAEKFPTAKHFGSWLGLCPDNRITGGKIYSVKTRDVKSRVAEALRLAAQSLWQAKNYFGDLYRRWKARLGSPKAITAMAHKLARILWHMLKFKEAFNPEVFAKEEAKLKRKKLQRLHDMAASLNYQLIPQP